MKPVHFVLVLAILAAGLLAVAGPGVRLELWDFRTGFQLMRWAAYAGLATAAASVALLVVPRIRRAHLATLGAALLLGLVAAYIPWHGLRQARELPAIHDISTDLADPPAFVAVMPLRADAPNSAEHGGEAVAALQRQGYPDVEPLLLEVPPDQAYARALATARAMGWKIVAADRAVRRIEATDTTTWFGFKDDVVVRVRAEGTGSRVDVRSVSRVGGSDVGANASRISRYLRRLQGR